MPEPFRMDAKAFIERPFFVTSLDFNTSLTRYSSIPNSISRLPGDIIRSNSSLLNAMKIASYYRADLMLNISMAGTIAHSGCVLVGIIPPAPWPLNSNSHMNLINTLLSGPHAFLFANEATTINLGVPWYCNTDMATLDMDTSSGYKPSLDIVPTNGNYATLAMVVINPLTVASGGSTTVPIVVEACFKALDILVPTPRYVTWQAQSLIEGIVNGVAGLGTKLLDQTASGLKQVAGDAIDGARQYVRGWTGLHNPNDGKISGRVITTDRNFPNVVDSTQFFEKLDPYSAFDRIVKQPIFGTNLDEMSIQHITAKKQMVGSFKVVTSDSTGKLLWSRPISPYQGGNAASKPTIANNIELLHYVSRAWRGGLKLHIQSVMNNKQQVKLRVLKMYNPSLSALSSYPAYQSIVNAPSHLIEFTQGGQEQIISLPFLCRNDLCPCARDLTFEAMFHGMYYIYVAQPLVIADGSPLEAEFNVYISGESDLTFYGYSTEIASLGGFSDFKPNEEEKNVVLSTEFKTMYERSGIKVGRALVETRKDETRKSDKIYEYNIMGKSKYVEPQSERKYPSIRSVLDKDDIKEIKRKNPTENASLKSQATSTKKKPTIKHKMQALTAMKVFKEQQQDPDNQEYVDEENILERSLDIGEEIENGYESQSFAGDLSSVDIKSLYNLSQVSSSKPKKKKSCSIVSSCVVSYESQGLEVMNQPQKQDDKEMMKEDMEDFSHIDRLRPNTSIRDYVRRMYKITGTTATVPSEQSRKIDLPLCVVAGEDNFYNALTASPLIFLSNMYYGKTLGFKFKVKTALIGSLTKSPNYVVHMYYVPPNFFFNTASNTILGSQISSLPVDSDPFQSTPTVFPLPFQITPVQANEVDGSFTYEFVIPDVTFYKFMGSPNKLVTLDTPTSYLSTMDFGNLLIQVTNQSNDEISVGLQIFAGFTDESRLGYHSIAPQISSFVWKPEATDPDSIQTLYLGNPSDSLKPPVAAINTFIYKGGFL